MTWVQGEVSCQIQLRAERPLGRRISSVSLIGGGGACELLAGWLLLPGCLCCQVLGADKAKALSTSEEKEVHSRPMAPMFFSLSIAEVHSGTPPGSPRAAPPEVSLAPLSSSQQVIQSSQNARTNQTATTQMKCEGANDPPQRQRQKKPKHTRTTFSSQQERLLQPHLGADTSCRLAPTAACNHARATAQRHG